MKKILLPALLLILLIQNNNRLYAFDQTREMCEEAREDGTFNKRICDHLNIFHTSHDKILWSISITRKYTGHASRYFRTVEHVFLTEPLPTSEYTLGKVFKISSQEEHSYSIRRSINTLIVSQYAPDNFYHMEPSLEELIYQINSCHFPQPANYLQTAQTSLHLQWQTECAAQNGYSFSAHFVCPYTEQPERKWLGLCCGLESN